MTSIEIATVNGAHYTGQDLHLGDELTFKTVIPKMPGWQSPKVVPSCYQDVNGDGTVDTNMLGPDIVYSWVDTPDAVFTLGATGDSIWRQRVAQGYPSAATGRADLCAYGWKGGKESVDVLATVNFQVV